MVMALIVGMGLIPIPSGSLTAGHGHEWVESNGQRSQSWSWSCHQALCALFALEASSLEGTKQSDFNKQFVWHICQLVSVSSDRTCNQTFSISIPHNSLPG